MQALLDFENLFYYLKNPISYLEVRDGKLLRDNQIIGHAKELFHALNLPIGKTFFPAWIGFVGYEYAQYFGLKTHESDSNFPDAAFMLFDEPAPMKRLSPRPTSRGPDWIPGQVGNDKMQARDDKIIRAHFEQPQFLEHVSQIQEEIRCGDVYQVNLSRQFEVTGPLVDPFQIYAHLKKSNPSPFMGVLEGPDWSIVSGSPERLFSYRDGIITTQPIAGTKPNQPGAHQELLTNIKELAEHAMLVDLMRNDLSKVCLPGSVKVPKPFSVEPYRHVMHLVSEVRGRSQATLAEVFEAIFPGGTITGAPKESVMNSIARHESMSRGPYTGSFGYVSSGLGADFNILIRSLFIGRHKTYFSAGAGIVIGSDPDSEYLETNQKIKQFLELFHGISMYSR